MPPPTLTTAVALLRACHPEPAAAVTIGAGLLALATGRAAPGVAAVMATVAASQLAVGWHNDWLDADRDRIAGRPDKPVATGVVSRRVVGRAAAVAAVAVVPLAALSGPKAASAALLGLAAGLSYNWPLKFTAASVLPYAVAFAALPVFVLLGRPATPPWWLLAAGATLGAGAHFVNVLPDFADDARTGVRGLPHRLGAKVSAAVAEVLLATAIALLAFAPPGPPTGAALAGFVFALIVLAVGGVLQLRSPRSRAAFRTALVAALIAVGLLFSSASSWV